MILIDGDNTHNFMQQRLVKSLGLQVQSTPTLHVLVDNGNEVESCTVCRNVVVQVQGHLFMVDLHVLPLCGVDVVLRVQWLKSLGPVLTDYSTLTMKFVHHGSLIELKSNSDVPLSAVSPPQLRHLTQTQSVSAFFHIRICSSAPPMRLTHPDIISLSTQFASLFQTPTTLPPSRTTNHSIHLSPNSTQPTFAHTDILTFRNKKSKHRLHICFKMALSDQARAPSRRLSYWSKGATPPGGSAWTTEP